MIAVPYETAAAREFPDNRRTTCRNSRRLLVTHCESVSGTNFEGTPMTKYRKQLPQLADKLFVTDGGLETVLVFQQQIELPEFAAIDLLQRKEGGQIINDYMKPYVQISKENGLGLVMETATWRASPDWGPKVGFPDEATLAKANRQAVMIVDQMRQNSETTSTPIVVSGTIGPRGEGYDPGQIMSVAEASNYHGWQAAILADSHADLISAITMTNTSEAIGVTNAAKSYGMEVVISFTVETDGRLPTGQSIENAVAEVDDKSGSYPVYYMINCAHPTHFADKLAAAGSWVERIKGIRANASTCSHEELDNSEVLDEGNPAELGRQIAEIRLALPHINIVGGCCGTDHRHIGEIAKSCSALAA